MPVQDRKMATTTIKHIVTCLIHLILVMTVRITVTPLDYIHIHVWMVLMKQTRETVLTMTKDHLTMIMTVMIYHKTEDVREVTTTAIGTKVAEVKALTVSTTETLMKTIIMDRGSLSGPLCLSPRTFSPIYLL